MAGRAAADPALAPSTPAPATTTTTAPTPWTLEAALSALHTLQQADAPLQLMAVARLLQATRPDCQPLGHAGLPADDALRIDQAQLCGFAPREVVTLSPPPAELAHRSGRARLVQDAVGLLGPNGPLPYAWTEYLQALAHAPSVTGTPHVASATPAAVPAGGGGPRVDGAPHAAPAPQARGAESARESARKRADSFLAFINLVQRRHLALLYRAWAEARAETAWDPASRRQAHPLTQRLSALAGLADACSQGRDSIPDDAKRAHAAALSRRVRNPGPLADMLARCLDLPVQIEEFSPQWLTLPPEQRTLLGRHACRLGQDAMAGARSWEAQTRFRVRLGPLPLARYRDFLPGAAGYRQVRDLVARFVGATACWDLVPLLLAGARPQARLGALQPGTALGHTAWLGPAPVAAAQATCDDLALPMAAPLRPAAAHADPARLHPHTSRIPPTWPAAADAAAP